MGVARMGAGDPGVADGKESVATVLEVVDMVGGRWDMADSPSPRLSWVGRRRS